MVHFQEKNHTFDFQYRDPWAWITSLVTDSSLAPYSTYHSVENFYHDGDFVERLYDKPCTGRAWAAVDVSQFLLVNPLGSSHIYLGRTPSVWWIFACISTLAFVARQGTCDQACKKAPYCDASCLAPQ